MKYQEYLYSLKGRAGRNDYFVVLNYIISCTLLMDPDVFFLIAVDQ